MASSGSQAAIPPLEVALCPNMELCPFFEFQKKLTPTPKVFVDLTEDIFGWGGAKAKNIF
jgi:hypothetical protein